MDIGGGHRVEFYVIPAQNFLDAADILLTTVDENGLMAAGIIDWHRRADTGAWCGGALSFIAIDDNPVWTVESLDPLTITPSVLCSPELGGCGDHGWITAGNWIPA